MEIVASVTRDVPGRLESERRFGRRASPEAVRSLSVSSRTPRMLRYIRVVNMTTSVQTKLVGRG